MDITFDKYILVIDGIYYTVLYSGCIYHADLNLIYRLFDDYDLMILYITNNNLIERFEIINTEV